MGSSIISAASLLPAWNLSVLFLLAKATLILCAALGITLSLRRASAGARHLVWLVTLAMLLVVPALTAWAPFRLAVLPPATAGAVRGHDDRAPGSTESSRSVQQTSLQLSSASPTAPHEPAPSRGFIDRVADAAGGMSALSLAVFLWGAVVLGIVGALAWAGFSVRRITSRARPLTSRDWQGPLLEIADRMGLDDVPRLLQSDAAKMPFACGVLTPTIVLPAEAESWTLDRRRAVLLHELAHVRRRDLLGHTVGRLACAVYWFHPLVWTAAKRLRSESERACDDLALSCGTRATDYAEHLLDIVTSVRGDGTPLVALAMARRKEFEGRMLAILDPELRRGSPSRRQSATLIASLAVLAIAVGAVAPVQREAQAAVPKSTAVARTPGTTHSEVANAMVRATRQSAGDVAPNSGAVALESIRGRSSVGTAANGKQQAGAGTQSDDRPVLLAKVLTSDTSAALRRIAAWGLQEYADVPVASAALANAVKRDADASVREMSAWALGSGGTNDATALAALGAALRGDAVEKVRATAAWSLGNIGDNSAVDALAAALGDASKNVRARAAWALGNIEPKDAPKALVGLLGDADPGTRELAAWALYQIADPATAPAIEAALKKEQVKEVQLADIRAIAVMGEKSVDVLRGLLESSDANVKAMAVRALAGGNASGPWPHPWPEPRPFP
jgi:beta-lactamase regulating signal transducer with metallopeptidase domain/HEAT repeat protein